MYPIADVRLEHTTPPLPSEATQFGGPELPFFKQPYLALPAFPDVDGNNGSTDISAAVSWETLKKFHRDSHGGAQVELTLHVSTDLGIFHVVHIVWPSPYMTRSYYRFSPVSASY